MIINLYRILKAVKLLLEFVRCFPHLMLFYFHHNNYLMQADTRRWLQLLKKDLRSPIGFIYLLSFYPEFRNLFYQRIGPSRYILNTFCPKRSTLIIEAAFIGEGLFIQHGFATAIGVKSIGKNCWINQQVTIGGDSKLNCPTLMDNVRVYAGAVIIGNLTIGNNSIIGANATVFKDVPDNCTVYPTSSIIMKWNKTNNSAVPDNKNP